jgi:hypothetical protein
MVSIYSASQAMLSDPSKELGYVRDKQKEVRP